MSYSDLMQTKFNSTVPPGIIGRMRYDEDDADNPLIKHIDFSQFSQLIQLTYSGPLEEKDLQRLKNVPTLQVLKLNLDSAKKCPTDFSNIGLEKLKISSTPMLKSNPIEFNFNGMSSLAVLILKGLGISYLPEDIKSLPNLKEVYLNGNQLTSVDLSDFSPTLHTLDMSSNKLQEVIVDQNNTALTSLSLANNELEQLPETLGSLNLSFFNVQANSLQKLPGSFTNLTSLRSLNVGHNLIGTTYLDQLSKLTDLYSLTMKVNTNPILPSSITALDLSFSRIEERIVGIDTFDVVIFPVTFNFAPSLKVLERLNLSFCELTDFPEGVCLLFSLKELDVSVNPDLNQLPESIKNLNLEKLNIIGTDIVDLDFLYNSTSLRELSTPMSCKIDIAQFPSLQTLETYSLEIPSQHFTSLTYLKTNVDKNNLDSIIQAFPNLRSLYDISSLNIAIELPPHHSLFASTEFTYTNLNIKGADRIIRVNEIRAQTFMQILTEERLYMPDNYIRV